jgi:hypothetical protein
LFDGIEGLVLCTIRAVKSSFDNVGLSVFFLLLCAGESCSKAGEGWLLCTTKTFYIRKASRSSDPVCSICRIELFDGKGGLALCTIERLEKDGASVCAEEEPLRVPPPVCNWEVVAACGETLVLADGRRIIQRHWLSGARGSFQHLEESFRLVGN